ncbi:MAG: ExeM/NucH family extracellular endonuclease [Aeromicrobium sp.]
MQKSIVTRWVAAAAIAVASLVAIPAAPATADPAGTSIVINEIYPNGGSGGGLYQSRYFELYNPTSAPISVAGWSLQGRSAAGVAAFNTKTLLGDKTIAAGGYFLVEGIGQAANTKPIPTPDATGGINVSATSGGQVALSRSDATLTGDRATLLADPNLVDLVGYGPTTVAYEGAGTAPLGGPQASISRSVTHVDTDDNAADFRSLDPPSPCNSAGCAATTPAEPPVAKTIAEVQGAGFTSPLVGVTVTVRGVVTATYPTGKLDGAYIQTEGTGDVDLATHTTSDAVFVSSAAFAAGVEKGDFVEVTGIVSESFGLTQVATPTDGWDVINAEAHDPVEPASITFPLAAASRESLEGTLVDVTGRFTVTNNYTTDRYGDIGLVDGDEPLDQPTNVVAPGAAATALQAANDARLITLDDGSDIDRFFDDTGVAMPWLTADNEVRVGAAATITDPLILDYRRSLWRLQPTERLVAGGEPATFTSTGRAAAPDDVGGDVKIGTFNVLNYFTTTGQAYDALPGTTCSYFDDRAGNPITVDSCGAGPRGAADGASLQRQQDKIVTAINALDADVVSLEEIENSIAFGPDRDAALSTLVDALNEDAGGEPWAFVPSPAEVPTGEDVIRTAFIYQRAAVEPVGDARILIGSAAFDNAREPLAQSFKPVGSDAASTFAVIVNHFKSKGSGSRPEDDDQGDGQGPSNYSRTLQARALVAFADEFAAAAGTNSIFLTGDFNAYNKEDPVRIIEEAGYVNVAAEKTDKETYQFDGQIGSLDHVFASDTAYTGVTDADIWNINSYESPGREYSRYNYNIVDLFDGTTPFRASDHDPEIVGFDPDETITPTTTSGTAPSSIRHGADVTVSVDVSGGAIGPTGEVTVTEGAAELGSGTLTDGAADIVVPDLSIGTHRLTVSYAGSATHAPSSTTVVVRVLKVVPRLTASVGPGTYGTSATLTVTGEPGASGLVVVAAGDEPVGMGSLAGGTGTIQLSSTLPVGTTQLTVFYGGSADFDPTSTTTSMTVAKASTTIQKVSVSPVKIVKNRTKPFVRLRVRATGFTVDGGTVTVRANGKSYTGTVKDGTVRIRLGKFPTSGSAKKVTVTFAGNGVSTGSSTSFTVTVRRK